MRLLSRQSDAGVTGNLCRTALAIVSWLPLSGLDHKVVGDAALRSVDSIGPVAEATILRAVWIVVLLRLGTVSFRRRELAPRF